MTPARLAEIREYAQALALLAWARGRGNQRDLNDIVTAIEQLIEIRQREAIEEMERATTTTKPTAEYSANHSKRAA